MAKTGAQAGSGSPVVSPRSALVLAALATVAIHFVVPFGDQLLYPVTLLYTWVHEMGHGLTALALGGGFSSLDIFANGSGVAYTAVAAGWREGVVAAGGLLAPAAAGGAILAFTRGPRRARALLLGLGAALALSLLFWVRSLTGWIALPLVMALLGVFLRRGSERTSLMLAQFLALTLGLGTLAGRGYFFADSATINGATHISDIARVAASFGGPVVVWGALLFSASLGLLYAGIRRGWAESATPRLAAPAAPADRAQRRARIADRAGGGAEAELDEQLEDLRRRAEMRR